MIALLDCKVSNMFSLVSRCLTLKQKKFFEYHSLLGALKIMDGFILSEELLELR